MMQEAIKVFRKASDSAEENVYADTVLGLYLYG